jgi:hypothetical protein
MLAADRIRSRICAPSPSAWVLCCCFVPLRSASVTSLLAALGRQDATDLADAAD